MQMHQDMPAAQPSVNLERPPAPYDYQLESLTDTVGTFTYKQPHSNVPIRRWEMERSEDEFETSPFNPSGFSLEVPFAERRRAWGGMKPDTAYAFRVRARGINNQVSMWSEIVRGHTLGEGGVPSTPKQLRIASRTEQSLILAWSASVAASSIREYVVYRDEVIVHRVPGILTTFEDKGIRPNTEYTYRVVARDCDGLDSASSVELRARTPGNQRRSEWRLNAWYEIGMIVTHQSRLWECIQAHTSYAPEWAPGWPGSEALWVPVD